MVPNPDVLIEIADSFKLDFSCTYDEPGNCVYGEFIYNGGVLTGINLDIADFVKYDYDEEIEVYQFEGKNYSDSAVIKETLLQRKRRIYELCCDRKTWWRYIPSWLQTRTAITRFSIPKMRRKRKPMIARTE